MVDVDHFKKYNDHFGHHQGDHALKALSEVLKALFQKKSDFIFRLGGEEFAVLFISDGLEEVDGRSEQLRCGMLSESLDHPLNPPVEKLSISIGGCIVGPQEQRDNGEIYRLSDQQLYKAKFSGRNCVCLRQLADFDKDD